MLFERERFTVCEADEETAHGNLLSSLPQHILDEALSEKAGVLSFVRSLIELRDSEDRKRFVSLDQAENKIVLVSA